MNMQISCGRRADPISVDTEDSLTYAAAEKQYDNRKYQCSLDCFQ